MEEIVRQTLLFDFYGELLTLHQQRIFEAVVCNDTGYSELAAAEGVSRQGIHDLVRRCSRQLEEYEQKLHLVEKFLRIREYAGRIQEEGGEARRQKRSMDSDLVLDLTEKILEEL